MDARVDRILGVIQAADYSSYTEDESVGMQIAERIRHTVAENAFEAGPDEVMRLTCSVGLATYPLHGRTREALLDAADKAMYRAKSEGRNQVCSASALG